MKKAYCRDCKVPVKKVKFPHSKEIKFWCNNCKTQWGINAVSLEPKVKEPTLEQLIKIANDGLEAEAVIAEYHRDEVVCGGKGCWTTPFGEVIGTTAKHRFMIKKSKLFEPFEMDGIKCSINKRGYLIISLEIFENIPLFKECLIDLCENNTTESMCEDDNLKATKNGIYCPGFFITWSLAEELLKRLKEAGY